MLLPRNESHVSAEPGEGLVSRASLPLDRQCQLAGLPMPTPEFRFHPTRRWQFDWAFHAERLAIEIEGAAFKSGGGRHTRGAGFRKDLEKYAEAAILGWRIVRVLPEDIGNGKALGWIERALKG